MLRPYRKIEETAEYSVYEFRTIFLYLLYGVLAAIAVGYFASSFNILITGVALMVLYLLAVTTQYIGLNTKIKQAAKRPSVEMSGSKWSFLNPLRVKMKKENSSHVNMTSSTGYSTTAESGKKISFICPKCQTKYSADIEQAGKKGSCKNCGAELIVPNNRMNDSTNGSLKKKAIIAIGSTFCIGIIHQVYIGDFRSQPDMANQVAVLAGGVVGFLTAVIILPLIVSLIKFDTIFVFIPFKTEIVHKANIIILTIQGKTKKDGAGETVRHTVGDAGLRGRKKRTPFCNGVDTGLNLTRLEREQTSDRWFIAEKHGEPL